MIDDPTSQVRLTVALPDAPGTPAAHRPVRLRAVAAALAAGGLASLSVVLLGPPASMADTGAPTGVIQTVATEAVDAVPLRRPDITLGGSA